MTGRVQGVFFRAATKEQAEGLGLNGWVRNRPDGRVEIVAEGDRERLGMLSAWAWQGPPGARVEQVEEAWSEAGAEPAGFRIVR